MISSLSEIKFDYSPVYVTFSVKSPEKSETYPYLGIYVNPPKFH